MSRKSNRALVVVLGFLLAAGGAARADEIWIGAHGGLSIPSIRGSQTDPYTRGFTSRQGPFFGISGGLTLTPRFSLVAEINYNSQGGLRKGLQPITMDPPPGLPIPPGTILYASFRNETVLDYIEIPVMGRLAFGDSLRFFVNAGPYIGFLVRARALTKGTSALYLDEAGTIPVVIPPDTQPLEVDLGANANVHESLKDTNVGLAGGVGVVHPVGPGELILEGHFQLGLTVIQKDVATSGKSRTGAVVISLGYSLPVSRQK